MKKKKRITGTLQKMVNIGAETEQGAIKKGMQLYRTGEIILYAEDMIDVNFDTID